MGSKPKTPETDYQSLWSSYDRWQQEDKMWYDESVKTQKKDAASYEARLAASGVQRGGASWDAKMGRYQEGQKDFDQLYADKQADLKGSVAYEELQGEYKRQQSEGRTIAKTQFQADQEQAEQDKPYEFVDEWATPEKSYQYYEDELTGERTYGEDYYSDKGFEYEGQTFEEWGKSNYGSATAENPYEDMNPADSEAVQRAKQGASGGQAMGGGGGSLDEDEVNPWM